ncbi:E3 ubiquitin-protein ligase ATL9-like [Bidens hawaiensis]|uniref:E3 ubiquitin-protein ligase ATL9-like n=1 Tax=Bidens hawaiensis TaxID=980011 RepID=UPI00404B17B2
MDIVAPPYTTPDAANNPQESHNYLYLIGFFFTVILLIIITYVTCRCKDSQPRPQVTIAYNYRYDSNLVGFSQGVDDDVLVTFPTFVYCEITTPHKPDTVTDVKGTGCSICLEDYKPTDVVRLIPECGHLFHVKCIDTWLKAHPTCPMCRKIACINLTTLT